MFNFQCNGCVTNVVYGSKTFLDAIFKALPGRTPTMERVLPFPVAMMHVIENTPFIEVEHFLQKAHQHHQESPWELMLYTKSQLRTWPEVKNVRAAKHWARNYWGSMSDIKEFGRRSDNCAAFETLCYHPSNFFQRASAIFPGEYFSVEVSNSSPACFSGMLAYHNGRERIVPKRIDVTQRIEEFV